MPSAATTYTGDSVAAPASISPAPWRLGETGVSYPCCVIGLAVFMIKALVAWTKSAPLKLVVAFNLCITKAATPALNGPAIEVPLIVL